MLLIFKAKQKHHTMLILNFLGGLNEECFCAPFAREGEEERKKVCRKSYDNLEDYFFQLNALKWLSTCQCPAVSTCSVNPTLAASLSMIALTDEMKSLTVDVSQKPLYSFDNYRLDQ